MYCACGQGRRYGKFLRGCQPKFSEKEDFLQTKFADKEGVPRVPTSTSTNGVLHICRKAKNLLQTCRQAKSLGSAAPPPPMDTPLPVAYYFCLLDHSWGHVASLAPLISASEHKNRRKVSLGSYFDLKRIRM